MGRTVKQLFTDVAKALSWLTDVIWSGFRQLIATGKAADNIKSARLFPVAKTAWTNAEEWGIYLGEYHATGHYGYWLSSTSIVMETHSIAIPWQANDWRRNSPFHSVYVDLPFFGILPLPVSEIISCGTIVIDTFMMQSGVVRFDLAAHGGGPEDVSSARIKLGSYYAQASSDYFIGASNVSPLSIMGAGAAGIGAVAAIVAAGSGVGAVAAGAAGIVGITNSVQQISAGQGGAPGMLPRIQEYTVFTVFHDANVLPSSVSGAIGTPTMEVKTIGTLSGYVQTSCASVSVACDAPIRDRINNLLDGGIFYE